MNSKIAIVKLEDVIIKEFFEVRVSTLLLLKYNQIKGLITVIKLKLYSFVYKKN